MFTKRTIPLLVSLVRIRDFQEHNAFTDLFFHEGKFYLLFREADSHESGGNGSIRIMTSSDGITWESKALIEEEGLDLRDPKLSVMPNGQLHLIVGGTKWDSEGEFITQSTYVAFSKDDLKFSPFFKILETREWLWRITWYQGVGYGVAYENGKEEWSCSLYKTVDGLHFEKVMTFVVQGKPNEATIRFTEEGEMRVLVRCSKKWNTHALYGSSHFPYEDWEWSDIGFSLGGPNFLILDNKQEWFGGRVSFGNPWGLFFKTALLSFEKGFFRRELVLPSWGDTGYPGMLYHEDYLWMSYYSSHEDKTSVYVAKILLN